VKQSRTAVHFQSFILKEPKHAVENRPAVFALRATSAFPAFLQAQFQAPNKDELEMASDPKAPGADAVYLYREGCDRWSTATGADTSTSRQREL